MGINEPHIDATPRASLQIDIARQHLHRAARYGGPLELERAALAFAVGVLDSYARIECGLAELARNAGGEE